MTSDQLWFNTGRYSPVELAVYGVSWLAWIVAYAGTLRVAKQRHFVQIPAAAITGKLAWDFLWGFVYTTDLGAAFTWGVRAWFVADCVVLYYVLRDGDRILDAEWLRRWFRPAVIGGVVTWAATLFFMTRQGHDTGYGAISGFMVGVVMSSLFIVHLFRRESTENFSEGVAWAKMAGTAALSLFCVLVSSDNRFLLTACFTTLVFDLGYIAAYYRVRRGPVPTPIS